MAGGLEAGRLWGEARAEHSSASHRGGRGLQPAGVRADRCLVVAAPHSFPPSRTSAARPVHWWRLPLLALFACALCSVDTGWKALALAAGRSGAALDTPTTALKPYLTLAVGVAALVATLLLPRLFVPGALLVAAGVASNLISLSLWRAVPNPLSFKVADAS